MNHIPKNTFTGSRTLGLGRRGSAFDEDMTDECMSAIDDAVANLRQLTAKRAAARAAAQAESAARARELALGDVLKLGSGELKSGGFRRDSILSDAFEALVAAIYRDGGFAACRDWLQRVFAEPLAQVGPPQKDPKTLLQEWLQGHGLPLPHYELLAEHGEEHARQFDVACVLEQPEARFEGSGGSRRAAEQVAAGMAIAFLEESSTR